MNEWKHKRKIVLGITGGISAYKSPEIVRALVKSGCDVEVVLTEDGERFVSPMVLSVLSGRRTWTQRDFLSDEYGWKIPHISLADWADAVLIAPCTAETISRIAQGSGKELFNSPCDTIPRGRFPRNECAYAEPPVHGKEPGNPQRDGDDRIGARDGKPGMRL